MFNVIKMDLYRLTKMKSTYIFLSLMAILIVTSSFLFSYMAENNIADETVNEYGVREGMSQEGIEIFLLMESKAEMISDTTTGSNLIFMFPAIFICIFSGAYQKNNYIRNISGYLPKKYELLISNLIITIIYSLIFVIIAFTCASVGYTLFSPFYNSLPTGDVLEFVKFIFLYYCLLVAISCSTTFFTILFQNQQLSIIFAVLYGSGILVNMIGNILTNIFSLPDIREFEPSTLLYKITLQNANYLNNFLISIFVIVIFFILSFCIIKKRDYN